jgi:hypothetical protein
MATCDLDWIESVLVSCVQVLHHYKQDILISNPSVNIQNIADHTINFLIEILALIKLFIISSSHSRAVLQFIYYSNDLVIKKEPSTKKYDMTLYYYDDVPQAISTKYKNHDDIECINISIILDLVQLLVQSDKTELNFIQENKRDEIVLISLQICYFISSDASNWNLSYSLPSSEELIVKTLFHPSLGTRSNRQEIATKYNYLNYINSMYSPEFICNFKLFWIPHNETEYSLQQKTRLFSYSEDITRFELASLSANTVVEDSKLLKLINIERLQYTFMAKLSSSLLT